MNRGIANYCALILGAFGSSAVTRGAERLVPHEYPTIKAAMKAADRGDEIVLSPGVYQGEGNRGLFTLPAYLTIRSTNPLDPVVVASTIIDCGGERRAFTLMAYPRISGLTIIGGSADAGGAMISVASDFTVDHCILTGNTAAGWGGAVYVDAADALITNCVITGNTAGVGGAVAKYSFGRLVVRNCFIAGNFAQWRGGGLDCETSRLAIENCTIVDNVAAGVLPGYSEGGGGAISAYRGGSIQIVNSIVWGNTAPRGPQIWLMTLDDFAPQVTIDYCDVQGGEKAVGAFSLLGPEYVKLNWGDGSIDEDPCFLKQAPVGSPLLWQGNDYHLSGASPCINAGDATGDYAGQTDIDGQARVQQGRIDIGADETDYPMTIVIGTCDTGVANRALGNCTTMADEIASAETAAKNHGAFSSAVARLTNTWLEQGLINETDKEAIQACAGQNHQ